VEEKLERLERHFDNITNAHVILEIEKDRQKAEATIHVSRGQVYADSEDENMYAAIDSLADKLDRQIKKHKEKLKDHHRGEGLKNQEAV
jgi:putative sigma-54 modulation protein